MMITPPHFGLKKQEKHNETDYKKEETRLVAVTSPVARSQGQNQRERDEYYK